MPAQALKATAPTANAVRRNRSSAIAHERGWEVHRFDAGRVEREAAARLGVRTDDVLHGPRLRLGPPWTKDHRMALAATVVAR